MRRTRNKEQILFGLRRVFGKDNVKTEWDVAKNKKELYCPRVDFAVGPFNTDASITESKRLIDESYVRFSRLLKKIRLLSDIHNENLELNSNPRCFLTIEQENKTSRKHRLGSLINASALGKIGIVVTSDERVFKSFVKIRKYLISLQKVGKMNYAIGNVMILTEQNFLKILREESDNELPSETP